MPQTREISISWFHDLTGILGKYLAVLRYELDQTGRTQTLEALIHAEIVKLLIRQFTSGCVETEYLIGKHFALGKDKNDKEYVRKFRADIALFHPVVDPTLDVAQPMAILELKRTGDDTALLADIYRLAVVSLKTGAMGYFVFAGPREHVHKSIESLSMLQLMEKGAEDAAVKGAKADVPHEFLFKDARACEIYNVEDHAETLNFYGQRVFAEENDSEKDPYRVRIFAFHTTRELIAQKVGQRISLKVESLDGAIGAKRNQEPLPEIE